MLFNTPNGLFSSPMYPEQAEAGIQQLDPEHQLRVSTMAAAQHTDLAGENPVRDHMVRVQEYTRTINELGEDTVRMESARRRQAQTLEAVMRIRDELPTGPLLGDTLTRIADESAERNAAWALEENFVDNMTALARMESDLDVDETALEAANNEDVLRLMWQGMIDEVWEERESRPWGYGLFEMAILQSLPFYTSSRMSGTEDDPAGMWQNIFAGNQLREQSQTFHEHLRGLETREEQYEYMRSVADDMRHRMTRLGVLTDRSLLQFQLEELWDALPTGTTNTFNALDNVPVVGTLARWGVRGLRSSTAAGRVVRAAGSTDLPALLDPALPDPNATRTVVQDLISPRPTRSTSPALSVLNNIPGGGKVAEDLITAAVEVARREGVDAGAEVLGSSRRADLYSSVSLHAINPWGPVSAVSASETVAVRNAAAGMAADLAADAGDLLPTARLNTAERASAVTAAEERLADLLQNRPARDVAVLPRELADGTTVEVLTATIGRLKGGAFTQQHYAERALREYGLPGQVRATADGFWIDLELPITERGFYTSQLDMQASSVLSRIILSARQATDPRMVASAVLGDARAQRFRRGVIDPFIKRARSAGAEARAAVSQIWEVGAAQRRWLSREEFDTLHRAIASENSLGNSWALYRELRRVNDLDYEVRNATIYRQMSTEGYQTLSLMGESNVAGRQLSRAPATEPVYNISTNQFHRRLDDATIPDGYRMYTLAEPIRTPDGYVVRTVMGRINEIEVRPLARNILPYQPGGHRMPQGNWFVRQARTLTQPDGSTALIAPRTYIGAMVPREAKEWALTMGEAQEVLRRIVRDGENARAELDELLEGRRGYPDPEDLLRDAREGRFDLDTPFEVLEDRQLPSRYRTADPNTPRFFDEDETADQMWARSHGSMYYGRRGEDVLRNYQGDSIRHLNVYEMMNRSLSNISRMVGYGDYKQEIVARFDETYRRYFANAEGLTSEGLLFQGSLRQDIPRVQRESLLAQRNHIQRVLGHQTWADRMVKEAQLGLIAFVDKKWARGGRMTADMMEWWNTSNPIEGLRGAAFDLKLGLFNVAQFPLQVSTMLAIQQLSPVHGTQGMLAAGLGRIALINPNLVEGMIRNGAHKMVGLDAEDFRAFNELARRSGFMRIDGQHALISELGPTQAYSNFLTSPADKAREIGRFAFNEAETMNRMAAGFVAFREIRDAAPDLAIDSPEFARRWIGRTDDYAFNMSRNAGAMWQHGLASIPTQFWSYSERMMEAMFSNKFSRAQRARLILGQSVLYGSYGVPMAGVLATVSDMFNRLPQEERSSPDLGTLEGWTRRGLMDHVVEAFTGLDLKVSERVGVSNMPATILANLYNRSDYGEISVVDFFGGATLSIWGDVGEDLIDVGRFVGAELAAGDLSFMQDENQARDALNRLAMNVSGYSNMFKGYMLYRYGQLETTNTGEGVPLVQNLSPGYAFAQALFSYQPGDLYDLEEGFSYLTDENHDRLVTEASRTIQNYRHRFMRAVEEGDQDRQEHLIQEMTLMMNVLDPAVRSDALRQLDDNWAESLLERIETSADREETTRAIQRGEF